MHPATLLHPLRTLYAKIFLWFCATILFTVVVFLVAASLTGSQPFGRRWMAVTQDLYARSALDFYRTGGAPALTRYLDQLASRSVIDGQLLDSAGRDVLGRPVLPDVAGVLDQANRTHLSCFRLGRTWTTATPMDDHGTAFTFVMVAHPIRSFNEDNFLNAIAPRLLLGLLLVAFFCLFLARHITRPIRILEDAATRLAAGSLSVRAGPRLGQRRDELGRMAVAFDRMAERIQGLLLAQQEMLGHISHELRSPLTRIGVSLEFLRRGQSEPPDIARMQLDLDRLDQMIGEILDITRMDIAALPLERMPSPAPVALAPLLAAIARDASFEAQHARILFSSSADCSIPGDEPLLRSCFENIVRNALLYTPEATLIEIALTCGQTAATVTIRDEGPGVPAASLPRLFDLFYRVGTAPTQHPSGTGFGLAIAQRIVTLHRGTITAQNRTPHGLELTIILPLA